MYLTPKTETLISLNFDSKMLDTSVLFGDAKDGGRDVDTVVTIKMATDVPPPSSHHLPEDLLRCTHTQSHGCTHKHTQTLSHKHTHKHTGTHTPSQKHTHTEKQHEFFAMNFKNFPPLPIAMCNPHATLELPFSQH